jgi:hypothetical protein
MALQQMCNDVVCIDQHMKNPPKLNGFGGNCTSIKHIETPAKAPFFLLAGNAYY